MPARGSSLRGEEARGARRCPAGIGLGRGSAGGAAPVASLGGSSRRYRGGDAGRSGALPAASSLRPFCAGD